MKNSSTVSSNDKLFNKYEDFASENKDHVNQLVLKFAKKLKKIRGAIFMDGEDMNTTNTILSAGIITKEKIHIPEIDPTTQKIHKSFGINSYAGKLENFLINTSCSVLKNINLVFFDTMGMVEGNYTKKLYPMENLKNYLSKCESSHIVVCLTFCLRSRGKFHNRKNMIEQIEQDYVIPRFTQSQYNIITSKYYKYHRDSSDNKKTQEMIFMAFELRKDYTIDANNIIFVTKTIKIKKKDTMVYSGYAPN